MTISNTEKWKPVDQIISEVNRIKAEGKYDQLSYIQRYIDKEFNKPSQQKQNVTTIKN